MMRGGDVGRAELSGQGRTSRCACLRHLCHKAAKGHRDRATGGVGMRISPADRRRKGGQPLVYVDAAGSGAHWRRGQRRSRRCISWLVPGGLTRGLVPPVGIARGLVNDFLPRSPQRNRAPSRDSGAAHQAGGGTGRGHHKRLRVVQAHCVSQVFYLHTRVLRWQGMPSRRHVDNNTMLLHG